jgi:hypothetical protein
MTVLIKKVNKGEKTAIPLISGGWVTREAPADGLVIIAGNDGVYLTEDELKGYGYVREACTPSER